MLTDDRPLTAMRGSGTVSNPAEIPRDNSLGKALPRDHKRRRWPRYLFLVLLLGVFVYAFRAPILRTAADVWIVNQPVRDADAAVILGGGRDYRPLAAAHLYEQGKVRWILITQSKPPPTVGMGVVPAEGEVVRRILLKKDVPEEAIAFIGRDVASTFDEAVALRAWVEESKSRSVLIPTDLFHTRRVRWVFRTVLEGTGVDVRVIAVEPPGYNATNWWQHHEGLITFQNEIIKYLYYRTRNRARRPTLAEQSKTSRDVPADLTPDLRGTTAEKASDAPDPK
jgi:uncharacterized SAM-binding protein YcdF (DUF218 family)